MREMRTADEAKSKTTDTKRVSDPLITGTPLAVQREENKEGWGELRVRLTHGEVLAPLRQMLLPKHHSLDSFQFSYGILIFNRVIIVVAYLMSPTIRPD